MKRTGLALALALGLLAGCAAQDNNETTTSETSVQASTTRAQELSPGVLVFSKTAGFRHESIPAGVEATTEIARVAGFEATATEDASVFSSSSLESYDVIVFLNTTGDVLDASQQRAMEEFIASGKGFVGVHSAADTEYEWSWYGELVGAYFDGHPEPQQARVSFADPGSHPITEGMPAEVERFDEWYDFRSQPPSDATVLATLDESTYEGGAMGDPHPITWAREVHGGRSVYTGFGHTRESFEEPLVLDLLDNSIRWAAAAREG